MWSLTYSCPGQQAHSTLDKGYKPRGRREGGGGAGGEGEEREGREREEERRGEEGREEEKERGRRRGEGEGISSYKLTHQVTHHSNSSPDDVARSGLGKRC